MVVTCPNCDAKYSVDESRIPGRGARTTCQKCSHVFTIYKDGDWELEPDPTAELPARAEDLDVHSLDFQKVGIKSWKVKANQCNQSFMQARHKYSQCQTEINPCIPLLEQP